MTTPRPKGDGMRPFRRKSKTILDDDAERCPRCTERIPAGASECAMCGVDLRPLRSSSGVPKVDHASSAR